MIFGFFKGAVRGGLAELPKMWEKRKQVLSKRKVLDSTFLSRILGSERKAIVSMLRPKKSAGKVIWPLKLYMKIFL